MSDSLKVDIKEFELPETVFSRDIEDRVFQAVALHCLGKIHGVALIEGNFIDAILGRENVERVKGIQIEQDNKTHSIKIKIAVNVCYGVSIPEKAEEIQKKVIEEVTRYTGLHVATIHLIFKNVIPGDASKSMSQQSSFVSGAPVTMGEGLSDADYEDEF